MINYTFLFLAAHSMFSYKYTPTQTDCILHKIIATDKSCYDFI